MRRVVLVVLAVTAISCASRPQVTEIPPEDLPEDIYSTTERMSREEVERRVVIYFVRRVNESTFVLEPVERTGRTRLSTGDFAMEHLLEAKLETEAEQRLKLGTAIPKSTELLGIEIADGAAEVNLSSAFEDPEDELTHLLRVAQVVWTLTELHDVDVVRFLIHGVPQPVITQDGTVQREVSRARYRRFAPVTGRRVPVA